MRAWIEARVRPRLDPKRDVGYTRTAVFQLFLDWAVDNGHRKDRLPKSAEFIDRLAEDFPAIRHRCEQDRRIRGITVLSEDWVDRPVLHENDKYDDSPANQALLELGERASAQSAESGRFNGQAHRGREEWLAEMLRDPNYT